MKAGFAAVDITPPLGTPIAGNFRADNLSHGVYHEIFSRSICLSDASNLCSFSSVDLCAISAWQVEKIRERVAAATTLKPESIMVAAVHNHSGPTTGFLLPDDTKQEIIDDLIEKISRSIIDAYNRIEPITIRFGRGENADLPNNRRVWCKDGLLHMNWEKIGLDFLVEPAGPIDPEILVLSFYGQDEELKGVITNYTLHPAILAGDNNLTSADYVGFFARHLQKAFPHAPEILFFNGTEGNINHLNPWNPDQVRGFAEAERVGTRLAEDVKSIIAFSEEISVDSVYSKQTFIPTPRRKIPVEKIYWAKEVLAKWDGSPISLVDGCPPEVYAQATLELAFKQNESVQAEVQIFKLGPVTIVTLPGEFFVEYGFRVKEMAGKGKTLVVGLANGISGYVPTPKAFEEGGYEVTLGRQSYLAENAGEIIMEKIATVLRPME